MRDDDFVRARADLNVYVYLQFDGVQRDTHLAALAAGNTVVVKPSEYAPLSVLELAEAFAAAGLPAGVLNLIPGGPEVGRAIVQVDVDRIVFIGSVATGRAIGRALAERGRRPPLLELGGKDAIIVCADADPRYTARGAVGNAFTNMGQMCSTP